MGCRPDIYIKANDGNGHWLIKGDSVIEYTFKAHGVEYKGVCKKAQGDKFDVKIGKRISYLKAVLKMKKVMKKNLLLDRDIVSTYISSMTRDRIIQQIDSQIETLRISIKNIEKKIEETTSQVQPVS